MWDYGPGIYGQLILYDAGLVVIVRDWDPSDGWSIDTTLSPRLYYIRVYTAQNFSSSPYRLGVSFLGSRASRRLEKCPWCD
ncbi:MAG: hypothetical protein ACP5SI_08030 [Chloroflexia bacterium]